MNEQEYYYNRDLLELLEDMINKVPDLAINDGYWLSYINNLKERLDKMFDGERKENE